MPFTSRGFQLHRILSNFLKVLSRLPKSIIKPYLHLAFRYLGTCFNHEKFEAYVIRKFYHFYFIIPHEEVGEVLKVYTSSIETIFLSLVHTGS